jgi:hypothetical protein
MRNVDYIAALAIENADLGIPALVPPPMREKEKHGNAKRKRKVMFVQRSANWLFYTVHVTPDTTSIKVEYAFFIFNCIGQ